MPAPSARDRDLKALAAEVSDCRACPRLVEWREQVAREKRASFRDEDVLGPAGSRASAIPRARVLIVGLAPAAHGGNRTGRVFTGDRSGDFLFASLHRCGLREPADLRVASTTGCDLRDAYVTAAVRCAPPANKPTPAERDECMPYLVRELELLSTGTRDRRPRRVRIRGGVVRVARRPGDRVPQRRPRSRTASR